MKEISPIIQKAWGMDVTKIPHNTRLSMDSFKIPFGAANLVGTPAKDAPDGTLLFLINDCTKCSDREKALAILLYRLREYEFLKDFE